MEEQGGAMEEDLPALPPELWTVIFSFLSIRELYPSCFVLSKAFLAAILDDRVWERRCKLDLNITERADNSPSWRETYEDNVRVQWDLDSYTVPPEERDLLIKQRKLLTVLWSTAHRVPREELSKHLTLSKQVITWDYPNGVPFQTRMGNMTVNLLSGAMVVRAKRGYSSGRSSFDFKILRLSNDDVQVGVVSGHYESRIHTYLQIGFGAPTSYCPSGQFWDLGKGLQDNFVKNDSTWAEGDTIGVMLDFDLRKIFYFKNTQWIHTQAMMPTPTLWPVAYCHVGCNSIQICGRSENYPLPEE